MQEARLHVSFDGPHRRIGGFGGVEDLHREAEKPGSTTGEYIDFFCFGGETKKKDHTYLIDSNIDRSWGVGELEEFWRTN